MANIVLIIVAVLFSVLVLAGSVYFLIYFQDPEDKWVAWLPKVVVVTGLAIACYNVLLLPLDVANQNGNALGTAGLPMKQLDLAFFLLSIIYVAVVIPFVILYYESLDDTTETKRIAVYQLLHAFKWIVPIVAAVSILIAVLYIFIGHSLLSVTHIYGSFQENVTDAFANYCPDVQTCFVSIFEEQIKVAVPVYIIGIASCLGWILFSVFGGIGLSALPIDAYISFKHRPRRMKLAEYVEKKKEIGEFAKNLYRIYQEELASKQPNADVAKKRGFISEKLLKKKENSFKRDVYLLENEYRNLEEGYRNNGGNPLLIIGNMVFGILSFILSLIWMVHLLIYLIPLAVGSQPVHPFLNSLLIAFSKAPLFGPLFYGIFAFYLLLCVFKGCIKFGLRILFFPIHPIKIGGTMMNSMVFNVGLILLSSLAVVQFCSLSFKEYARYTSIISIFYSQIYNLAYLKYLYTSFIFVLLVVAVVTAIYLKVRPYDQPKLQKRMNV